MNLAVGSLRHRKNVARITGRSVTIKNPVRPVTVTENGVKEWQKGKNAYSGSGYWRRIMIFDQHDKKVSAVIEAMEKKEWMTAKEIHYESRISESTTRKILFRLLKQRIVICSWGARQGYEKRWSLAGEEEIQKIRKVYNENDLVLT